MIPGLGDKLNNVKIDDNEFVRIEAIISSMTKKERKNPKLLNASRRIRIAKGSGTTVQAVNKFMTSFEQTQKLMKKMTQGKTRGMFNGLNLKDLKNFNPADFK